MGHILDDKKGFQSKEAHKAAVTPPQEDEAEDVAEKAALAVDPQEAFRKVKVKPRQNVKNVRIGHETYQLRMNKEMTVPQHVKVFLEERNLI